MRLLLAAALLAACGGASAAAAATARAGPAAPKPADPNAATRSDLKIQRGKLRRLKKAECDEIQSVRSDPTRKKAAKHEAIAQIKSVYAPRKETVKARIDADLKKLGLPPLSDAPKACPGPEGTP